MPAAASARARLLVRTRFTRTGADRDGQILATAELRAVFVRISASKAAVGAASCHRESGWPSQASRRTRVRKALRPTAKGTPRATISSTASRRSAAAMRSGPQAVLTPRSSAGTLRCCRAAAASSRAMRGSPLRRATSAGSSSRDSATDEPLDGGLPRGRLAERRQHLGDVAQEQRVRADHEHPLAVELRRGARTAGRPLGGGRRPSCRCPVRPAPRRQVSSGARITTSCSAAMVATMSRISPVRDRSSSASSGSGMPPWCAASTLSGSSNTSSNRSSTWRCVIRKRRRRRSSIGSAAVAR